MSRLIRSYFGALLVGIGLASAVPATFAAGAFMSQSTPPTTVESRDESWYREQETRKPTPTEIVQHKAMIRAEQRMARMASMSWYGMSNSRPTGAPTPFTSRYSPVWEMPGGRPYSWYPYARPGYVMYWR
ncbi:MAG: hypothetical protein IT425_05845 [Pirellulales bacterium]|nr:hypothetical protein [Pirellulales bacterium]